MSTANIPRTHFWGAHWLGHIAITPVPALIGAFILAALIAAGFLARRLRQPASVSAAARRPAQLRRQRAAARL